MAILCFIIDLDIPLSIYIPKVYEVISQMYICKLPCKTPPWFPVTITIISSGITHWCGFLPINSFGTSTTFGERVIPLATTNSDISDVVNSLSYKKLFC